MPRQESASAPNDLPAALAEYAASAHWVGIHLGQFVGIAVEGMADEVIAHAKSLREHSSRMRSWLPEELFGASPDPWEESPQRYCRILLEILPSFRNDFAHRKHYWHGVPADSLLIIENVHGLIEHLFRRSQR